MTAEELRLLAKWMYVVEDRLNDALYAPALSREARHTYLERLARYRQALLALAAPSEEELAAAIEDPSIEARMNEALDATNWREILALLASQNARRVPVGQDGRNRPVLGFACAACRRQVGARHADGCDQERCAVCGQQRIACGCDEAELVRLVRAIAAETGALEDAATPKKN